MAKFSPDRALLVDTLMEELKLSVVEKNQFEDVVAINDNNANIFGIFGRSGMSSKKNIRNDSSVLDSL